MLLLFRRVTAVTLTLAAFCGGAHAQDITLGQGDTPANFEQATAAFDHVRQEAMIPMRDGVRLFTVIMIPKHATGSMPIVLTRTPYNATVRTRPLVGTSSPNLHAALLQAQDDEALIRNGYIRVHQDIRGRYKSEGNYIVNRPLRGALNQSSVDHSTDAWDTIDWLVKNVPGNNGRVGITGVSYDGFLSLMALFEPHPALQAAVPVNPMVDGWSGDDWYHNGAFRQTTLDWIYTQTSTPGDDLTVPWGYYDLYSAFLDAGSAGQIGRRYHADRLPFWNRTIDNPAYNRLWREQAVQILLKGAPLRVPTLMVHALFDQEDIFGAVAAYSAMEQQDSRNDRNYLVIGPWFHGQSRFDGSGFGKLRWNSDTSLHFREKIRQVFWDEHLKGERPARPLSPVHAFETGANEWREYDAWPPRGEVMKRKLYLSAQGGLSFTEPGRSSQPYTEYVSDPAKPVPYRLRPIRPDSAPDSTWRTWLSDDQRPFADRPDVVSFVSAPLTESLRLSGEPVATLHASTSGTDADWVVKLIDLYPDEVPYQPELGGFQFMVSADILRGRYRENTAEPVALGPGKVLPYRLPLPHVNHTFRRGHRIMVQIQSSWFPLYDRNPQTFVKNIAWAQPEEYRKANQRIHHASGAASFIELPIRGGLPAAIMRDAAR